MKLFQDNSRLLDQQRYAQHNPAPSPKNVKGFTHRRNETRFYDAGKKQIVRRFSSGIVSGIDIGHRRSIDNKLI